jgi:hypothetical protein
MDGPGQWQKGYKEQIGSLTTYKIGTGDGKFDILTERKNIDNVGTTADLKNLGFPTGRNNVPKDLNQHYEAKHSGIKIRSKIFSYERCSW